MQLNVVADAIASSPVTTNGLLLINAKIDSGKDQS
jgi:hypothetical protein